MGVSRGVQVAIRFPLPLYEAIKQAAEQNKWDMSKQIRATLARDYGVQDEPYLPPVPNSGKPARRRRKPGLN